MVDWIETIEDLEAQYRTVSDAAIRKVATQVTPIYKRWIDASRFCVLSTVGPNGTDGSPRGDDGPVVEIPDPDTILMPDWRGNNRLDSLRNIVADGRVSLMFMVPGSDIVLRVNGAARLTSDEDLRTRFQRGRTLPATVIVVRVGEVYAQCPKSCARADIWSRDDSAGLPTLGDMLQDMTKGDINAEEWEASFPGRMKETLW